MIRGCKVYELLTIQLLWVPALAGMTCGRAGKRQTIAVRGTDAPPRNAVADRSVAPDGRHRLRKTHADTPDQTGTLVEAQAGTTPPDHP